MLNSTLIVRMRKRVLGISPAETTFSRRGFRSTDEGRRSHLERMGAAFVAGYHAALEAPRSNLQLRVLSETPEEFRGFVFEGAGMGLALLDWLTPWDRGRVPEFLKADACAYTYLVHVGAGWAMARLPGNVDQFMSRFDPLLRWLLVDGYGFHEGFFHWRKYLEGGSPIPKRLRGYARRVFYQGFGRCLWFINGGEITAVAESIRRFPAEYHRDLWSGVGLASTYAGVVSESALVELREAAGTYTAELAQGAAFAAKARQRGGNLTDYQDLACEILCGRSAREAAAITDEMLEDLPFETSVPSFEIWRSRIRLKFQRDLKVAA